MRSIDFMYLYLNDINAVLYDMIMKENYSDDNFSKLNSIIVEYTEHFDDITIWKVILLNEIMRISHHGGKRNVLEHFENFLSDIISLNTFLPYFNNATLIDIDKRLSPEDEILVIKNIIDDEKTCEILRFQFVQKIQYLLISSYLYITDDKYKKIYEDVISIKFDDNLTKIYGDRFVFYFAINSEDKK